MPTNDNTTANSNTNTDNNNNTPDLTSYLQVHRALRASNGQLVAALGTAVPTDVTQRAAKALHRWFAGYQGELRSHHEIEDRLFFPALAARVPAYAEYASTLSDDHHRLDTVIDRLDAAIATMAGGTTQPNIARERALAHAVEMRDLMSEHLDFEDSDILPMFERNFGADEYADLDKQALKEIAVRQALFTAPWWMATAEPEAAAKTLSEAPIALKVVYRLTRRRYARLTDRAFGHVTASRAVRSRS